MKKYLSAAAMFLIFNLLGCSSGLINLSTAKRNLVEYHESGRYIKEVAEAVEAGFDELERTPAEKNTIVVFDVDDTALSTYSITKELDFGYVPELWDKWIEKADAPAIKPVKELYDTLISRGYGVVFLTGRKEYQYGATIKNLKSEGFTVFDTLITRSEDVYQITAVEYKSAERTLLVNKGFKIAAAVGDQHSDLEGPHTGLKIKVPNYMYGID